MHLGSLTGGQPGIADLASALSSDRAYRLVGVGPYDTSTAVGNHDFGIYAIWQKVSAG